MFLRPTVKAFRVVAIRMLTLMLIGCVPEQAPENIGGSLTRNDAAFAQVPDDIRANLTGRGHALLIGVARYDDNAWPELGSVTADIDDLARGLKPHFATVDMLINPTADTIRTKLREFMIYRWNKPDERLLVYYAGHGFSNFNDSSRTTTGYVTGRDTPACRANCDDAIGNAIPFNYIDALNRETRVRQVITLFDSCFSGLAVARAPENTDAIHYAAERARQEIHKPARYYITAGGPTETVPADSPFASLFLKALDGAADFWKDGFISAEELGLYLQRNVPVYARRPLHPMKSTITDETARLSSGQFMFLTGLIPLTIPNKTVVNDRIGNIVEQAQAAAARSDYVQAVRLFRLAADQGNPIAQAYLGAAYADGLGGLPKDDREAVRLFRLAADQGGDSVAQTFLGVAYHDGLFGLPKDDREAVRLFRLAADQGNPIAQTNLGDAYHDGLGGLPKDDREAVRLFRLAAKQGSPHAQQKLTDLSQTR